MLPLQQELLVVAVPVSGHNAGVNGHRAGGPWFGLGAARFRIPGPASVRHGFACEVTRSQNPRNAGVNGHRA